MKKIIVSGFLIALFVPCFGQSADFKKLISSFDKKVELPVASVIDLETNDTIAKALLNKVIFDQQKERAGFIHWITGYSGPPPMAECQKT